MKVNAGTQSIYLGAQNNRRAQNISQKENLKNSPAFSGNRSIAFFDAIKRGGFIAAFTLRDWTFTNIPRIVQALLRNRGITGKLNFNEASEVAIRELLTGPSMCIIPIIVLKTATKAAGGAMNVPTDSIEAFSDNMKTILEKREFNPHGAAKPAEYVADYAKQTKKSFYERMFALSLGEDVKTGAPVSDSAKELAGMLMEHDEAPKRNFFKQFFNRPLTKNGKTVRAQDQIFSDIVTKFTDSKKLLTDDYTTLLQSDMNGTFKKPKSISSLIKDMTTFAGDVEKTFKGSLKKGKFTAPEVRLESFMNEFKKFKTGAKFITNVSMVLATALFMINIPKIYSLHKTNPGTDVFRDEKNNAILMGGKNANR